MNLDLIIEEIKYSEDKEDKEIYDFLDIGFDELEYIINDLDCKCVEDVYKLIEGGLIGEVKLSGKTNPEKKRQSREYFKKNKAKILQTRKKNRKTGKHTVELEKEKIKEKGGKTLTGRKKVKYHT